MAVSLQVLSNGQIIPEERHGWELSCPSCNSKVKYTVLNIVGGSDLFFYSDKSPNFILREEDRTPVEHVSDRGELIKRYKQLEKSLSLLENGQQFKLKNNVCCPNCSKEFPYRFTPYSDGRLYENKVIWVEGAIAYRGANEPSNKLLKVVI